MTPGSCLLQKKKTMCSRSYVTISTVKESGGNLAMLAPKTGSEPRHLTPFTVPCRHAACKRKGQAARRHATAPPLKVSLPVASSAPSRVRDELLSNFECPSRAPCRPSSPAEKQRPLTLLKLVRSRSTEIESRASDECFVESARVAPSRPVREAPYRSKKKTSLLAQIRVTLCDIKLAAG